MRGLAARLVALTLGVAILATLLGVGAAADVQSAAPTPGDSYCSAFGDYYKVSFTVEFIVRLAGSFNDTATSTGSQSKKQASPDEIRSTLFLVFSPKMEHVTGTLANRGAAILRSLFKKQQSVFARGVVLLQQAGLTRKQIEVLANARVDANNTDIERLTGKAKLSAKKLTDLAKRFRRDLQALGNGSTKENAAFKSAGTKCGAFPKAKSSTTTIT
jgi:hypothetical protein